MQRQKDNDFEFSLKAVDAASIKNRTDLQRREDN